MTKARDLANAGTALTTVSATELGYVDGVTSAIQTQINQKPEFTAGKNKIINGNFAINQRNFTSSTSSGNMFDRFSSYISDGTVTYSAQTFTLGTAPVAGYEGKNFLRCITSGQTATSAAANFSQGIESVRTFAGQTVTISFWAKAGSGTPKVAVEFQQQFGTGGSPSASVGVYAGQVTLSTSWVRYSLTVAVPSIAGKTIGTTTDGACQLVVWYSGGSDFNSRIGSLGIQSNTFDIWGVQVEAGSTATPFQTATGTSALELTASGSPTDSQVLTSDSTVAGGVKWASSGGMTLLSTTTLSGTTTSITGISGGYTDLVIDIYGVTNSSNTDMNINPNGSSTITDNMRGGTTFQQLNDGQIRLNNNIAGPLSSSTDNSFRLIIANYAATTNGGKPFDLYGGYIGSDSSKQIQHNRGRIKTTSAITSLDFVAGASYTAGTVKIYGVK